VEFADHLRLPELLARYTPAVLEGSGDHSTPDQPAGASGRGGGGGGEGENDHSNDDFLRILLHVMRTADESVARSLVSDLNRIHGAPDPSLRLADNHGIAAFRAGLEARHGSLEWPDLDYRDDALTTAPVLVRFAPIPPTTNRTALQKWLKDEGIAVADLRVAYVNKLLWPPAAGLTHDSLGWAALRLADPSQAEAVMDLLRAKTLEGKPLTVEALTDPTSAVRDPLRKSKIRAASESITTTRAAPAARAPKAIEAREQRVTALAEYLRSHDPKEVPLCFIDFELAVQYPNGGIPTEVAIISATIGGPSVELSHYHTFIHPGLLPPQLRRTAGYISTSLTGIPYKNFMLFNRNYAGVWSAIQAAVPTGAILVAKGKTMEEYGLQWICERAEGIGSDGLRWLRDRHGPFEDIVEYDDLLLALAQLGLANPAGAAPTTEEGDDEFAVKEAPDGFNPLPTSSAHRQHMIDANRCDYHQSLVQWWSGYHCALCDVRAYLATIRAAVSAP